MTDLLPLITVFPSSDGWLVRFHDDPKVRALFNGSDTVMSGFTVRAEPEYVFAEIKRRNPNNRIRLVRFNGTTIEDPDFQSYR
jgi:hypothetical protein